MTMLSAYNATLDTCSFVHHVEKKKKKAWKTRACSEPNRIRSEQSLGEVLAVGSKVMGLG